MQEYDIGICASCSALQQVGAGLDLDDAVEGLNEDVHGGPMRKVDHSRIGSFGK